MTLSQEFTIIGAIILGCGHDKWMGWFFIVLAIGFGISEVARP